MHEVPLINFDIKPADRYRAQTSLVTLIYMITIFINLKTLDKSFNTTSLGAILTNCLPKISTRHLKGVRKIGYMIIKMLVKPLDVILS